MRIGDKPIAIVAPSGVYQVERFEEGLTIISNYGRTTSVPTDLLQPHRYLAGDDDHRADQLIEALTSDAFSAVWVARGGYGITRILDRLPWGSLSERPVIGFSDVTALLNPLWQREHCRGIHGPVVHSLSQTSEASVAHLFNLLEGNETRPLAGNSWIPGSASGTLLGGNLCMLATLCGTPYQFQSRDSIVVLEEIAEPPYKVDRMLEQLKQSGSFDGVAGFAIGEFLRCDAPNSSTWQLEDVIMEHLEPFGVPVLAALPIGHGSQNFAFPVGANGILSASSLHWSER